MPEKQPVSSSVAVLGNGARVAPAEALDRLMAGNIRFVEDRLLGSPPSHERVELAQGQAPFAIVLGCSDSRVPVETVFDQMPGSIFVVRIAGNFLSDEGIGSIEYSVAVLKSSLILVMGHTSCGAVTAAVRYLETGDRQPGHIQQLVDAIVPAAESTRSEKGDWIQNAVVQNVYDNVHALRARSQIISDALDSGSLALAGGVYDLHSGRVAILHQL